MKIVSFNLNGIRSAMRKGFQDWVIEQDPDIIAVQETKAHVHALKAEEYQLKGYFSDFSSAEKKGYSGVGIYSKHPPIRINKHCGLLWADQEGRYIAFEFPNFFIISLYLPSGTSGEARQALKYELMDYFYEKHLKVYLQYHKPVLILGDWNIAHTPIDIKNAKANEKNSGFLPEERAWLDQVFCLGYKDAFRQVNPEPHQYTWWSFRGRARENNVGWRIDYHITTGDLNPTSATIYPTPKLSDHAPLLITYDGLNFGTQTNSNHDT